MYVEVLKFNKERNQLVWDMNNELKMLKEEIQEFWDAETVAERLDALVDTEYVWIGTQIKASYNTVAIPDGLASGIEGSISLMEEYLQEELGDKIYECLGKAREIVCRANAHKGKELDKDGKVMKDGKVPNATKDIALMIEEVTKPSTY